MVEIQKHTVSLLSLTVDHSFQQQTPLNIREMIVCVLRSWHDTGRLLDYSVQLQGTVDRQVSIALWWFETRFTGTAL